MAERKARPGDEFRAPGLIAVSGWLAICLSLLVFALLFTLSPWNFRSLMPEDGWVENLTALSCLLAGGLLFVTAWVETRRLPRIAFLVGGLAMAFLAGEEISWGQRIFGFATPDLLSGNNQDEANIHNMPSARVIIAIFHKLLLLLCCLTFAAYFGGKDSLFRIPLPSLPLALGCLATSVFAIAHLDRWLLYPLRTEVAALAIAFSYALFARRPKLALGAFATLALCAACAYVVMHHLDIRSRRITEQKEFLYSLFFLCYAAELLLAQGALAGRARPFVKLHHGWIWPASCALVLSGSLGLMVFERFDFQRDRATLEDLRRLVLSSQPATRSTFDVHVIGEHLVYFKTPCDPADINAIEFFVHIFPEDEADLPRHRKQIGSTFDNLHFRFDWEDTHFQQGCLVAIRLPSHPIAWIRTGQLRQDYWKVEFHPGQYKP